MSTEEYIRSMEAELDRLKALGCPVGMGSHVAATKLPHDVHADTAAGPTDDDLTALIERYVAPCAIPHVYDVVRRLARGEVAPQCGVEWRFPGGGSIACLLRRGHKAEHAAASGARWVDGGPLANWSAEDDDLDEQAQFWLVDQICAGDPETAESAARIVGMLRRGRVSS